VKVRGEVASSRKTNGLAGANAANAGTMDRGSGSLYVRFTIEERPRVSVASETLAVAAEAPDGQRRLPVLSGNSSPELSTKARG
jgi:hypothetical protein